VVVIPEYLSCRPSYFGWVQTNFASVWATSPSQNLNSLGVIDLPGAVRAAYPTAKPEEVQVTQVLGGSQQPREKLFVFPFLYVALRLQAFFLTFVIWLAFKILFIFMLLLTAIHNSL
jgi:hypothetical protein